MIATHCLEVAGQAVRKWLHGLYASLHAPDSAASSSRPLIVVRGLPMLLSQ